MPGRIEFDMDFKKISKSATKASDNSFNILLFGDFSGTAVSSVTGELQLNRINIDNFNQVMARFSPQIELDFAEESSTKYKMNFSSLDDFHPDTLCQKLDIFVKLKDLRERLGNPSTFAEAALEFQEEPQTQSIQPPTNQELTDDSGSAFEDLLGKKPAKISTQAATLKNSSVDISSFINKVVAPDIVQAVPKQQDELLAIVDQSISDLMRKILHHENFQKLEANWRAVYECVTRVEDNENLNIHIIDVSKSSLLAYARSYMKSTGECQLYQTVIEECVQILGGQSWSLLLGLYEFSNTAEDVECLVFLAKLAAHAGGPFISAANASVLGCDDLNTHSSADNWHTVDNDAVKRWIQLQQSSYASWLGLVLPRFLLRLPYGKQGEKVDEFDFEELSGDVCSSKNHSEYLWGNSAIVTAILMAQTYQNNEGFVRLGEQLELDDMPLHIFEHDGEKIMKPCAEVVMSERTAQAIIHKGIMPLMSYKNKNAVRLMCFRSVSNTKPDLQGPWN